MAWFFGITTLGLIVYLIILHARKWTRFSDARDDFYSIDDYIEAQLVSRHQFMSYMLILAKYSEFRNYPLMTSLEKARLNMAINRMDGIFYSYFNNGSLNNGSTHPVQEIKHLTWLGWRKNGCLSCNDKDDDKSSFIPWWEGVALPLLRSGASWWKETNQWPTNPNSDSRRSRVYGPNWTGMGWR